MFRPYRIALAVGLGTAICVFSGCTAEVAPVAEQLEPASDVSTPVFSTIEQKRLDAEQQLKEIGSTDNLSEASPNHQAKLPTPVYEPPFPERGDLFMAPKRQGRGIAVTPEGLERAVELIGFVNVNSPQVVLSIDGMVTPLEEGSKIAEIEVISIQPPSVVLQRGRQRWQTSLEN